MMKLHQANVSETGNEFHQGQLNFCKNFFLLSIAFRQPSSNQGLSIFLGTVEFLGMLLSAILCNLAGKRAIGSSTPSSFSN